VDLARMIMAALRSSKASRSTLTLAGPKAWTTSEVIELCEKLAGMQASVSNVPVSVLKLARNILRGFQWAGDAADRLAFADVLSNQEDFSADMTEAYDVLGIDPSSITSLEAYLDEYYSRILKKLKEVGASSKQTDFYV
jgi:uncharacterized protein YbjT (DUF2867 family)